MTIPENVRTALLNLASPTFYDDPDDRVRKTERRLRQAGLTPEQIAEVMT